MDLILNSIKKWKLQISASSTVDIAEGQPTPKPKHLRVFDKFEAAVSDGDVLAMVTQHLSLNEKPSDEDRADPLLYRKNSKFATAVSLARNYFTASDLFSELDHTMVYH